MISTIVDELNRKGSVIYTTVGISMEPLLHESKTIVEIHKITEPLKKNDIVLFERANGNLVLHRIFRVCESYFLICGDNQTMPEKVEESQIKGVVHKYYRNGRWHNVTEKHYLCYVNVWNALFPFRRYIMAVPNRLKRKNNIRKRG